MVQAVNSLWCLRVKYEFLENDKKNILLKSKNKDLFVFYRISDHIISNQSALIFYKKIWALKHSTLFNLIEKEIFKLPKKRILIPK